MSEKFFIKELPNGITLLGQHMQDVSSAAMTFLMPAGASHDPTDAAGTAAIATEWSTRGAGHRTTRQLHDDLDALGCQRNESTQSEHLQFSTAQLGRNLGDVLEIYADIIRRPKVEDETFEPCRQLTMQDLASLEDEPARKCSMMLRDRFYPSPLGRCIYGTKDTLASTTAAGVRDFISTRFSPAGTILAVAGNIDWDKFCDSAEHLFGDWAAVDASPVSTTPPTAGIIHIHKDSAQVHLCLAHKSVTADSEHYYAARTSETILSGGMSGRLFTEVREKRGLVYSVSSRYHSLKDYSGMFTYAGTTPEKAQETFDVTLEQLRHLADGITDDEMARAKTQLKSAMVMQGESTTARSNSLVGDWYHLHRLRSLDELSAAVDAVTVDNVMAYLHHCPADNPVVLYIGPEPINTTSATK